MLKIIWTVICILGGVIIVMIQIPVEQAKSNIGTWLKLFGFSPDWAQFKNADRIGMVLASIMVTVPIILFIIKVIQKRKQAKPKVERKSKTIDTPSSSKIEETNKRKTEIINQLSHFIRNGNALLLQIGNAHSSQFPSKYPLPKNMKPSPMKEKIAEWNKEVYNYLIVDVRAWAEYYHKYSTRDIIKNHKPYTSPQEKYRTSMIALMDARIDRIAEIIKHVNSSSN